MAKKSGDTREEEGAAAKNRKPREEEGLSEPYSLPPGHILALMLIAGAMSASVSVGGFR